VITTGVDQSIWMVTPSSSDRAAPHKIAAGHSAAISPKGDRIAFVRNNQIWLEDLSDSDKAVLLYQARSGVTSSQQEWSPDGSKIAIVSDRGDHSFVAVYDFSAKSLTYLEPTVDHDRDPVWSPDGKQVVFIRIANGGALQMGSKCGLIGGRAANLTFALRGPLWGLARRKCIVCSADFLKTTE
jgi:dipeptidyl aminopeptidase/acylaminoacyl peptidase